MNLKDWIISVVVPLVSVILSVVISIHNSKAEIKKAKLEWQNDLYKTKLEWQRTDEKNAQEEFAAMIYAIGQYISLPSTDHKIKMCTEITVQRSKHDGEIGTLLDVLQVSANSGYTDLISERLDEIIEKYRIQNSKS